MAVRGKFTTDSGDEYNYSVVQYRYDGRDYVRGASPEKLDSNELEWARVYITDPNGDPAAGIYGTLWGPYLDVEDIEYELAVWFEDDSYGEAVG